MSGSCVSFDPSRAIKFSNAKKDPKGVSLAIGLGNGVFGKFLFSKQTIQSSRTPYIWAVSHCRTWFHLLRKRGETVTKRSPRLITAVLFLSLYSVEAQQLQSETIKMVLDQIWRCTQEDLSLEKATSRSREEDRTVDENAVREGDQLTSIWISASPFFPFLSASSALSVSPHTRIINDRYHFSVWHCWALTFVSCFSALGSRYRSISFVIRALPISFVSAASNASQMKRNKHKMGVPWTVGFPVNMSGDVPPSSAALLYPASLRFSFVPLVDSGRSRLTKPSWWVSLLFPRVLLVAVSTRWTRRHDSRLGAASFRIWQVHQLWTRAEAPFRAFAH